jgi:murein DD-endopeptidase MepM/ murein hydrolase activator NlpD
LLSLRSTLARSRAYNVRLHIAVILCALLTVLAALVVPEPVRASQQLILPTPPGEPWRIIQGYACGTHNAWDRYSLDLAQVNGPTYGAPIRAALQGTVHHWEARSGTLILSHGNGFFTMYTHLQGAVTTQRGRVFGAGETLGFAGDRGSPGVPHLHFTAYTAARDGWSQRKSVPLNFAEGYDLPEIGGCNQHGGKVMTAMSIQPPQISFSSDTEPASWYNTDQLIEFTSTWSGGGLSQMWNSEPAADAPMFPGAIDGYAQLSSAGEGMNQLYVRVWGPDGKQTVASYGPIGYDVTPPPAPDLIPPQTLPAGSIAVVPWQPVKDAHSGTRGYRVYVGPDQTGRSEWFTAEPVVKTPPLEAGRYVVRVQSADYAGNYGEWRTIGTITVEPAAATQP